MADLKNVVLALDDLRDFVDEKVHPIVSPENWNLYAEIIDSIDEMREVVISLLKEQETINGCLKRKCVICPHCDNCDVDENGLLKEQEAHIVTESDFENADIYGFLPAWCEERYANDIYCECIKKEALHEAEIRYWTAKPSNEQRQAVKWDAID